MKKKRNRRIGPVKKGSRRQGGKQTAAAPSDLVPTESDAEMYTIVNKGANDHDYCISAVNESELDSSAISDNNFDDSSVDESAATQSDLSSCLTETLESSSQCEESSSQCEDSSVCGEASYVSPCDDSHIHPDADSEIVVSVQDTLQSKELAVKSPILGRHKRKRGHKWSVRPEKTLVMPDLPVDDDAAGHRYEPEEGAIVDVTSITHSEEENKNVYIKNHEGGTKNLPAVSDCQADTAIETHDGGEADNLEEVTPKGNEDDVAQVGKHLKKTIDSGDEADDESPPEDFDIVPKQDIHDVYVLKLDDETLNLVANNLKDTLNDEKYIVHKVEKSIRILEMTDSHNTNVKKSIFYDGRSLKIYVHTIRLHSQHAMFSKEEPPQENLVSTICQYLSSIVNHVSQYKVCEGIKECKDLWNDQRGIEGKALFEEELCFRSLWCRLLLAQTGNSPRCAECNKQLRNFRRQERRNEARAAKDKSKVPNKFLSRSDLEEKCQDLSKDRKLDKKTIKRLTARLKKKEGYVKLDEGLQTDIIAVLKKHEKDMTPLQDLFWRSQMDALSKKNRKSNRWHPMIVRMALKFKSTMTEDGYGMLREFVELPSSRRLYDYSHAIEAKEGCQREILQDIRKKALKAGPEEYHKYLNVLCDEMHIRAGLVLRRSTSELIGYTKFSDVETELKKLTKEMADEDYSPSLAKKVLVFFAIGITSSVKDVIAVYSVEDLSASQLYSRTWEVIYFLEQSDLKVLCFICDGAPINIKFIKMHKPFPGHKFLYATTNLTAGEERPLFFILDPPHLLKTTRNCVANSYSHKNTRNLWKNGNDLSWKVLEVLFEYSSSEKFRDHKLTKAHVKLTSFSCMKVSYAAQVFSASVAESLERMKNHEAFKDFQLEEIIKVIMLMNKFFDCLNGMEDKDGNDPQKKPDHRAYRESNDERFSFLSNDFLKFFDDWQSDVKKRLGFTQKEKIRMIISHQTLQGLKVTVNSFIGAVKYLLKVGAPKVYARLFNQDSLEQYFSMLRQCCGDDDNPTLKGVLDSRISIHAQGSCGFASVKGNTEAKRKRIVEVDDSPLPVRKKKE